MVDHHEVQRSPVQHSLYVLDKLPSYSPVCRIEKDCLFVQQYIGIVGHTVIEGMDVFKQGQAPVIGAHPVKVICHFSIVMHMFTSAYL